MKTNYQLETDRIISGLTSTPRLLLHACCAPCASYVLEYLSKFFEIDVFYFNPNIYPSEEYEKRGGELRKLISLMPFDNPVRLLPSDYDPGRFYDAAKGLEQEKEGGARCTECFELRLGETAKLAKAGNYDWFATTLTVSPHKNADLLNAIGLRLSAETGVPYLVSDFKKREGYKRSIELCREYDIYRQCYCGCEYSLRQAEEYLKGK
jgi:predicted adenine nucleotide alpha hydrolase (AANH) superfamily ATPase